MPCGGSITLDVTDICATRLVDPAGIEPAIFSVQVRRITINALSPLAAKNDTSVVPDIDVTHTYATAVIILTSLC